jgi:hypothetical protein
LGLPMQGQEKSTLWSADKLALAVHPAGWVVSGVDSADCEGGFTVVTFGPEAFEFCSQIFFCHGLIIMLHFWRLDVQFQQ